MAALARRGLAWAASDAGRRAAVPSATHVVENQAVSKPGNAFADDRCLGEGLDRYGASWAAPGLIAFGADVGSEEWIAIARAANERVPVLETHDRHGRATNRVVYDGSYHALMRRSLEAGAAGLAWETPGREGGHVARAAAAYLTYQLDPGVACPVTMTFASYPVLAESAVGDVWAPRVAARAYDPSEREVGAKASATVGMSMTEKQGGSDVRSNATTATAVGENEFVLRGHKWFTSAPMSDGFLTLANIDGAPSCFLVPRRLPDGTRNAGFRIQRLKSKLGDRSNASSEIEYDNAWAVPIGAPGRGIRTIVDMVQRTRLDCAIGSAALSREAARAAAAHCATRAAFGSRLIEQPLMARVLADLAVETEAMNATVFSLAAAFDEDAARARVATPLAKYWLCKRAVGVAAEAMECFGGNGYDENFDAARIYRQAPLNAIWEGSSNVIALDVLRALTRDPSDGAAFFAYLEAASGKDARYDARLAAASRSPPPEEGARAYADDLARLLCGAALLENGDPAVAAAYCAGRLGPDSAATYGAADLGGREAALLDRLCAPG